MLLFTIRDITERKNAEEKNKQMHSLLEAALDATADGILVVSNNGVWTSFNQEFLDMWKIPSHISEAKDDEGALEYVIDSLEDPDKFIKKVSELYANPEQDSFDIIKLNDGRIFERYSRPQWLNEEVVGRVWSFRDITERKKSEEERVKSEEKYRLLVENTDTGFVIVDEFGVVIEANEPYCRLVGIPKVGEILGRSVIDWTAPECKEENAAAVELCGKQGYVQDFETTYLREDGQRVNIIINAIMHETDEGIRLHALCRDITERKQAGEALLISEEKYRRFMDEATDSCVLFDSKLNYVDINKTAMKYVPSEMKKEDIIGRNLADLLPSTKESDRYDKYLNVIATGEPYISEDLLADPMLGPHIFVYKAFKVGQGLGVISQDITERKQAEKKLKQKINELDRTNQFMVGRELKMVELKDEVDELLKRAGESKKYHPSKQDDQ